MKANRRVRALDRRNKHGIRAYVEAAHGVKVYVTTDLKTESKPGRRTGKLRAEAASCRGSHT